jgi:hypothetical protein
LTEHRGSRRHILEWLDSPHFLTDLNAVIKPTVAILTTADSWKPKGSGSRARESEARLGSWGPEVLPQAGWNEVASWWLVEHRRANTPNWDFASTCSVDGRKGLVLIEAKAHAAELHAGGKPEVSEESASKRNHDQIRLAIASAKRALSKLGHNTTISIDRNYQLSNRIAFAWKLASLGVPVVLVYLGFIGDEGMRNPLRTAEDWCSALTTHAVDIFASPVTDRRIDCNAVPFWVLARTLPIISQSPPPAFTPKQVH